MNLTWMKPLGFANNHVLALKKEKAEALGASKVSDLKGKASSLTFGAPGTFYERADGYEGLTQAYGVQFLKKVSLDEDLMYQAAQKEEVDIITGFSTDPRIPQFDLAVLEDDEKYFPPYDAAPVVRSEVLLRYPQLRDALGQLAGRVSAEDMQAMNYAADALHRDVRAVVSEFIDRQAWPEPTRGSTR
jgi:osmoprotectant transport system substrate-binding protein